MNSALTPQVAAPGIVLGASAAVRQVAGLFRPAAPSVITRRFGGRPPPRRDAAEAQVDITRQSLRVALDWQMEAVRVWREHPLFGAGFKETMAKIGLERRSLVLFRTDAGPLRFAYIGETQRRFFGDAWADANIGKPQADSGYDAMAKALNAQYMEAILGGEPVHNHVVMRGLPGAPITYTHTLIGWNLGDRQVVVAMVAY